MKVLIGPVAGGAAGIAAAMLLVFGCGLRMDPPYRLAAAIFGAAVLGYFGALGGLMMQLKLLVWIRRRRRKD